MTVVTSSSWPPSGKRREVEVLRHRGAVAVGHAVLSQVAGAKVRCRDAQAAAAVGARRSFPCGSGHPLPGGSAGRRGARREAEEARLPAGVGLDAKRVGILPGDVQAAGDAHDVAGPIRLALLARARVRSRIPGVDDRHRRRRHGNATVFTFGWRHHPIAPVLGDVGHPIARQIDRRRVAGRRRRGSALPLRLESRHDETAQGQHRRDAPRHGFASFTRLRYTASTNRSVVHAPPLLP